MNTLLQTSFFMLLLVLTGSVTSNTVLAAGAAATEEEPEKGPHRGRMLRDGDFALELAIFETGVPPEYRVWVTNSGKPVTPEQVSLTVTLIRLGGVKDNIGFRAQDDFLRGDMEIYEPHSFEVVVKATYQGQTHNWHFENFEGRTRISADVAGAMGIQTDTAKSETLTERVPVIGQWVAPKSADRSISARFDGLITKVHVSEGQDIKRGDALLTVEANDSLTRYTIKAPIAGQVTELNAAEGEHTQGRVLARLLDSSALLAEVQVFPADAARIALGQQVNLAPVVGGEPVSGKVVSVRRSVSAAQATPVRVEADIPVSLPAGSFVQADIAVDHYTAPLAVKRQALQSFRDFTVVYAKVGDQYEVRMLELGREAGEWVEVLGGLQPGTEYVTENSYLIKADIEKSGASHDH